MKTSSVLKVISIVGGVAGILANMKVIPFVTPQQSVSVIGAAAALFKITDMIQNALDARALSATAQPPKPASQP